MIGRETRVTLGSGSAKTTGCDAGIPAIQARLSRFRATIQQGPVQRQETRIVQSCKTLDDFLPGFRPWAFRLRSVEHCGLARGRCALLRPPASRAAAGAKAGRETPPPEPVGTGV